MANIAAEELTCPLCEETFACDRDLAQHLTYKPAHVEMLIAEMASYRSEIEALKAAVRTWRDLARARGRSGLARA